MDAINAKQRAYLRSMAHALKPVVHIGAGGVTDAVVQSVEDALNSRELVKVKVLQGAPHKARETGNQLVAAMEGVHIPQTIGRTIVLYRPFPKDPEIKLPG